MKWMWSTAIVVAAVSTAVSAQSAVMHKSSKHDTMSTTTYTGCVEAVNHGGTYLLTHIDSDAAMHGDTTMHNDTGKMEKGHMPMDDAKMEGMSSPVVALAGSFNLKKHVGQKVSVAGSLSQDAMGAMRHDVSTLTVSSLKVVAKSCS